jgi:hypothetical protein
MPVEIDFWKVTNNEIEKIQYTSIEKEKRLEDIVYQNISIIDEDLLLIGRQIRTAYGKQIDLLAIDDTGKLTVIELKRDKTPRDVVAQTLDYASWIQDLSFNDIKTIYNEQHDSDFETGFEDKFGTSLPDKINEEHDMIIVCSELDHETERILNYLLENYNVPINAVFFRFFKEKGNEFISRGWLIDPNEVEEKSSNAKSQNKGEPWNGKDFIANIDMSNDGVSTWKDSIKYGFISAGGGLWYSRSLKQLQPGHRVFVMIPKKGYLGVGIVTEARVPIKDFRVEQDGSKKSIMNITLNCEAIKQNVDNVDLCSYLVRIEWLKTNPEDQAYWEKGLRANQNSVFKLKNAFTLKKLQDHFGLED